MRKLIARNRDRRRNVRCAIDFTSGVDRLEVKAAPSAGLVGALTWSYDEDARILTIMGTNGNDSILLSSDGSGNFTLSDGVTSATIVSGADDDTGFDNIIHAFIYGLDGNDRLNAVNIYDFVGNITLDGGDGKDRLVASDFGDSLVGGAGNDLLVGGTGDDILIGGDGDDVLHGEEGDDVLRGNDGDDIINGNQGDDNINGGAGNDSLLGSTGDDEILGGTGDDTINGGYGNDTVDGGYGTDTVTNAETVTDVP